MFPKAAVPARVLLAGFLLLTGGLTKLAPARAEPTPAPTPAPAATPVTMPAPTDALVPPPVPAESAASPAAAPMPPPLPPRSTVFSVHDPAAVSLRYQADPERIRRMVDRLVAAVTGQPDAARGWRSLVGPGEVVGIKINAAAGGASAPAHRAVVAAIVEGLIAAGHPREKILVWDRDGDDLRAAGYLVGESGRQSALPCAVEDITPKTGYDPKAVYSAPTLGKLIWGDLLFQGQQSPLAEAVREANNSANPPARPTGRAPSAASENLSSDSHFSLILSRQVTKIINVPVMSDSVFSGIAGALYNVTIPNLDNWRRFTQEPRYGNPFIAEIYGTPLIAPRVVLNLMDGTVAQIAGGPGFRPLYARANATLYASKDPVAVDAVALRYLELWRAQRGLPALGKSADHVRTAAEIGLGHDEAGRIDLRAVTP